MCAECYVTVTHSIIFLELWLLGYENLIISDKARHFKGYIGFISLRKWFIFYF